MSTCNHIQRLLEDYFDDELSPEKKTEVENHLQRCPECHATLEELRRLDQMLRGIKWPGPPESLWTIYPERVRRRIAQKRARKRLVRLSLAAGVLASAAAILLVVLPQPTTPPPSPVEPLVPISPVVTTARPLPLMNREKIYDLVATYVSVPGISNKIDIASEITEKMGRRAVPYLLGVLDQKTPPRKYHPDLWHQMHHTALELLAGFTDHRITTGLLRFLDHELTSKAPDYELCRKALDLLSKSSDQRSITTLVRWLDQEEIRSDILRVITQIGSAGKSHLLSLLYSPDETVKNNTLQIVGYLKEKSAVPTLIKMLQDRKWRNAVMMILGEIGAPEAVPHLFELIRDQSSHDEAMAALKKIGEAGISYLTPYLNAMDNGTRCRALEVLVAIGGEKVTPSLLTAGRDPNLTKEVIEALRGLGNGRATEFLIASLNNYQVAPQAIEVLGQRGDTAAVPYLIGALSDPRLLPKATEALKEITQQDFGLDQHQWWRWWQKTKQQPSKSKSGKVYPVRSPLAKGNDSRRPDPFRFGTGWRLTSNRAYYQWEVV